MALFDASTYYPELNPVFAHESFDYERPSFRIECDFEELIEHKNFDSRLQTAFDSAEDSYKDDFLYHYLALSDRLKEISTFTNDWNSYGSEAPNKESIRLSRDILNHLYANNFLPDRIVPSGEGGVGLVFLKNGKQADIEIFNDGDMLAGLYHLDKQTEVLEVSTGRIKDVTDKIYAFFY